MPFQALKFPPGIVRDLTRNAGAGGWYDADKIRFRNGLPEKIGGWKQMLSTQFQGICRSLFSWSTLTNESLLGVGTTKQFVIEKDGELYNTTPFRTSLETLGTNPLLTGAAGSGIVTVTDPSHGALDGDVVNINGATTTDGITGAQLTGEFVITLLDSNSYTISTSGSASSGATSGGGSSVTVQYEINVAPDSNVGSGFGSGNYGGLASSPLTTTLSGSLSDSATSFTVASATGFVDTATTLSSAISSFSTAGITVASVTNFPNRGHIKIDSEIIEYTQRNTDTNVLGGITRGSYGTTAASHSSSATVDFVGTVRIDDELIAYDTISTNTFSGVIRGVQGSSAAAHSSGANVVSADDDIGWGLAPNNVTTVVSSASRTWTQDNFGEDLLFNLKDGAIYYWNESDGLGSRGVDLSTLSGASGTPTVARQIMVSDQSRHIIAFGTNAIGSDAQDLMLVRFGDAESLTEFTPATTNSAGDLRLGTGSEIIGALQTRQEVLIWTDAALYSMRFTGAPFVFGLQMLASGVTIQSMKAAGQQNDVVYWMGQNRFQFYDGSVHTLDCPVLEYVFNDINLSRKDIFYAGVNAEFNEVTWWYCSASSTEIDRYVTYNTVDKAWTFGNLARSAWVDRRGRNFPIAASPNDRRLYEHDNGQDDGENDTGITAFVESSDIIMGQGETFQSVRRLLPDLSFNGSEADAPSATLTLKARNFPGANFDQSEAAAVTATQTVDVEQFTKQSNVRLRGRAIAVRVESSDLGTQWRFGVPMIEVRPDGRR